MLSSLLKKLFGPRPIWKETSCVFLRREMQSYCMGGIIEVDTFDYYAITYSDINSNQTKTIENSILVF